MLAQTLTNKRRYANLLLVASLLALPGCTGAPWEKNFWNPPTANGIEPIKGQAYPIQRASGENLPLEWPNLADVPERSSNPLPPNVAATQLQQLTADRHTAGSSAAVPPTQGNSRNIEMPVAPPAIPPDL